MKTGLLKYKSLFSEEGHVLSPGFYLNKGKNRILKVVENCRNYNHLGDYAIAFKGNISKSTFIENGQNSIPYLSAQIMVRFPCENFKFISKKFTKDISLLTLKQNQILLSCSGTIGKTRLVLDDIKNQVGSSDIIRIESKNGENDYGFVYSYLSSPTIFSYIQSVTYGSVVKHIEPSKIEKIPVPEIDEGIKISINRKIKDAQNYRNLAFDNFRKAVNLFESYLPLIDIKKTYLLNISESKTFRKRIDANLQIPQINEFYKKLNLKADLKSIESLSHHVFTPNIFKRNRVENAAKGVPYLGGADLLELNPKFDDFLSRKMKNIEDYILTNNWIAVQDSGSITSIGYVSLIPPYLNGIAATNNLVRIIPQSGENLNPYIFTFLRTNQGQKILKSLAYGTGQLHIDTDQIKNLSIPIISAIKDEITMRINEFIKYQNLGFNLEQDAIALVEKEIESWQN